MGDGKGLSRLITPLVSMRSSENLLVKITFLGKAEAVIRLQ